MSFVWSTHHSLSGAACFPPNYFIGPLVCWSNAGLIVPLKGPLVGIAKIPCTRSRKYRPPGPGTCIPKEPSTKPSTFIQLVYTVFTLWNTESVGISVL